MNTPPIEPTNLVELQYDTIFDISCPEDRDQGRQVYSGHIDAQQVLSLSTQENVRDNLVEFEGKQRRVMTQVHRAILETLENQPENFSVLNGGMVIVARDCEFDAASRKLRLLGPSIINGSQTQGVLRDYFSRCERDGRPPSSVHVTFELIVADDPALVADISIARNFQNDVMTISIAGRRGQLDELAEVMAKSTGDRLRTKETEYAGDFLDTEKLIQVLTAFMPTELDSDKSDRAYAYNTKTKCLKQFQRNFVAAKDKNSPDHERALAIYQYQLDIAPLALGAVHQVEEPPGIRGHAAARYQARRRAKHRGCSGWHHFPHLSRTRRVLRQGRRPMDRGLPAEVP